MPDFGVSGIDPEPKRGYGDSRARDRSLQSFSDAVWQRHEAGAHSRNVSSWPNAIAFHQHWPELALDLIIADWKLGAVDTNAIMWAEIDKLDPKPLPSIDWRQLYVAELQARPELEALLFREQSTPGDNIEFILECAELTAGERAVIRPLLYGFEPRSIAADLSWRVQTVQILIRNALDRLSWWAQNGANGHTRRKRGVVSGEATKR